MYTSDTFDLQILPAYHARPISDRLLVLALARVRSAAGGHLNGLVGRTSPSFHRDGRAYLPSPRYLGDLPESHRDSRPPFVLRTCVLASTLG